MRTAVELRYQAPLIEVRDAVSRELLTCLSSFYEAGVWLELQGYKYVEGTNGIWKMVSR